MSQRLRRSPATSFCCPILQGVRTLVLTNATGAALQREQAEGQLHGERWVHFPDVPGFQVTNKSGDLRAAVGPALAIAQLGSFRWLLYSDVSRAPRAPAACCPAAALCSAGCKHGPFSPLLLPRWLAG